jgi:S-(hydroxymethyl)glutathione dehydrogenase/alcohol dehydrogenase
MPSVLALFAHPDDIEFVAAGTMLQLQKRGWDLHYMNLCTGNGGSVQMDGPTTTRTRLAEGEEAARILGATHFIDSSACDPVAAVKELTGGLGADYTFEAVGLPEPIEQAYDSLRKGGTCVVAGICRGDARARINVNQLVYGEKTLKGSLYGSMRPRIDLPRIVEMHHSGALELDALLTKTWPLEQINEAYAALERGEVARSLIVWD